jgi:RNA polymerase sigma-70 factor (ECF subfamily)
MNIQIIASNYLNEKNDKNWNILYKRLYPGLKSFINSFLQDDNIYNRYDVIDDILSSTFYQILNNIHTYNNEWNFSTWCYAIAKNEILSYLNYNKKNFQRGMNDIYELDVFLQNSKIKETDVNIDYNYDKIILEENQKEIKYLFDKTIECIDELSKIYSGIIYDREIKNYKYKQIENKYDICINTVKSRIKIGKKIVGDKMKKRYKKVYDEIEFND